MNNYCLNEIAVVKGRLYYALDALRKKLGNTEATKLTSLLGDLIDVSATSVESQIYFNINESSNGSNNAGTLNFMIVNRLAQVDSQTIERASNLKENEKRVAQLLIEANMLDINLNMLYKVNKEDISSAITPLPVKISEIMDWANKRPTLENMLDQDAFERIVGRIKETCAKKGYDLSGDNDISELASDLMADRLDIARLFLYKSATKKQKKRLLGASMEEVEAFEVYNYHAHNGALPRAVYSDPEPPIDVNKIHTRNDVESISIAQHVGHRFTSVYESRNEFESILRREDISVKVLLNVPDVVEEIIKHMQGEFATYPSIKTTLGIWKHIQARFPRLEVRLTEVPMFHRIYLMKRRDPATGAIDGIADVRYYTYGNSNNLINPRQVYSERNDPDQYGLYEAEFECLWSTGKDIRQYGDDFGKA